MWGIGPVNMLTGVPIGWFIWFFYHHLHGKPRTFNTCYPVFKLIIITITFYSPLGATRAIRLCTSFDHLDSTEGQELRQSVVVLVKIKQMCQRSTAFMEQVTILLPQVSIHRTIK